MKKLILIVLAAIMMLTVIAGCQKRPKADETSSAPAVSQEPAVPAGPVTKEQAAANNAKIDPNSARTIQFSNLDDGDPIAVLETSAGVIKIRLFPEQTPKTAEAFEELIESGYYNGQQFSELVPGYKIECAGTQGADGKFPEEPEFSLNLWNFRGAVSLSNNGADFMVVQATRCLNPREELEALNFPKSVIDQYAEEGGAPHQDWKNPVFGMVVEGMDIVDAISAAKTGEDGKPVEPVVISATTMEYHNGGSGQEEAAPEEDGEESAA